jgi:hypothetical protein
MRNSQRIPIVILALFICSLPVLGGELRARTAPTEGAVESVWVSLRARFPEPGADGYSGENKGLGLVLIDPDRGSLGEEFVWDEPNTDHSIAIALDVHNQIPDKSADENGRVMGWFDRDANWYERPQREVSVHANGMERINVRTDYEFRTNEWVDVDVHVRYVLGGARVIVMLDGHSVIDQHLWDLRPMRLHAMVGVEGDDIEVSDLAITRVVSLEEPMPEPVTLTAFDAELLQNAATLRHDVDFTPIPESVGRVIATLTLSEPEMGYDHWDKKGTVAIRVPTGETDEQGNAVTERFEVFRYITPYRRGWTWHMDVTDLLPLFEGTRQLETHIGTYMKGWLVTFTLDFYEGMPEREPIAVMNLWNGDAEIGNPEKPVADFYAPRDVSVPAGASSARVRATVTGHGMHPNSNNAGEFMPIWRTLTISSANSSGGGDVLEGDYISMSERNHLWKTDCYLNPCRPQGGTWKFDRSGWAPGDKVEPWVVDVQSEFVMGDTLRIEYELDEYINEGRGETWAPHHWTDAVVVFYK